MSQSILEEKVRDDIFLEPDEKLLCVVGREQLKNYLMNEKHKKCFAVLSDRAVYCKGKCTVSRDRRFYQTVKTNFRLDLEEFKDIKYLPQNNQVLLSLTFFFLILGPVLLLLDKLTHYGTKSFFTPRLDAIICILLAGVFYLLYSIHRKTLLELLHTNGSISLNQSYLPQKEARTLIRYLRAFLNDRDNPKFPQEDLVLEELPTESDKTIGS